MTTFEFNFHIFEFNVLVDLKSILYLCFRAKLRKGERSGSVVERRTPGREFESSKPTSAVCP